jgi:protein phosphatase
MTLRAVELVARTDTGRVRSHNEDRLLAAAPLLAVADGMGGAQAGEVAAQTAVDALEQVDPGAGPEALEAAIHQANQAIRDMAAADPRRAGMGTTLTAALLEPDGEVDLFHVGDSRAYLLRDGRLSQLTRDHSVVAELVDRGTLTPEEAESHPQRNVITRALGAESEVSLDHTRERLAPGDVLVLCTDGLSSLVPEERIQAVVAQSPSLEAAARVLVDEANAAGGADNVTVVLARLGSVDGAPTGEEGAPGSAATSEEGAGRDGDGTERMPVIPSPPGSTPKAVRPPRVLQPVSRRRRLVRRRVIAGVLIVLALAAGVAAYVGSRSYFLSTGPDDTVRVAHGFPVSIGPLHLWQTWLDTSVPAAPVRAAEAGALAHSLRGQGEAVEHAARLVWRYGLPAAPNVTAPPPHRRARARAAAHR